MCVWPNEKAKKERWHARPSRVVISQGMVWRCVCAFQSTSERLMRQKRGSLMISGINHSQYVQLRSKQNVILNFPEKKNDLLINIDYPRYLEKRTRGSRRKAGAQFTLVPLKFRASCSLVMHKSKGLWVTKWASEVYWWSLLGFIEKWLAIKCLKSATNQHSIETRNSIGPAYAVNFPILYPSYCTGLCVPNPHRPSRLPNSFHLVDLGLSRCQTTQCDKTALNLHSPKGELLYRYREIQLRMWEQQVMLHQTSISIATYSKRGG